MRNRAEFVTEMHKIVPIFWHTIFPYMCFWAEFVTIIVKIVHVVGVVVEINF